MIVTLNSVEHNVGFQKVRENQIYFLLETLVVLYVDLLFRGFVNSWRFTLKGFVLTTYPVG